MAWKFIKIIAGANKPRQYRIYSLSEHPASMKRSLSSFSFLVLLMFGHQFQNQLVLVFPVYITYSTGRHLWQAGNPVYPAQSLSPFSAETLTESVSEVISNVTSKLSFSDKSPHGLAWVSTPLITC